MSSSTTSSEEPAIPQSESSLVFSFSNLFCFLTGLFLLLAFCLLPWFAANGVCDNSYPCNFSAQVHTDGYTGLQLVREGVIANQALTLQPNFPTVSGSTDTIVPPDDQFNPPLLWILPIVSLILLAIPLVQFFRKQRRSVVESWLLVVAFSVSILIELLYLFSTFSALASTKHAISQVDFFFQFHTYPALGFWFALLLTVYGGILTRWAAREEASSGVARRRLAHYESWEWVGTSSTRETYSTYRLRLNRPEQRTIQIPIVCPRCGASFTLSIASWRDDWLYHRLPATIILSALTMLVLVYIQQTQYGINNADFTNFTYTTATFFAVIVFSTIVVSVGQRFDGINLGSLSSGERPAGKHRLFY